MLLKGSELRLASVPSPLGSEDTTLAVWDNVSQSLVKRLEGWHQKEIRAVAFNHDGKFAGSCSMNDRFRV